MGGDTNQGFVVSVFLNRYHCPVCGEIWNDVWDCMCNDRCPGCRAEIEPYESENLDEETYGDA